MMPRTSVILSGVGALALALVIIISAMFLGLAPTGTENLNPSSTGTVSIMLTDPPSVPSGVSAVYLTYGGLQIHALGFPAGSGWVGLSSSGTVETLGLVNFSQTISSATVPSGRYDMLSVQIASMLVSFGGKNYTATLRSNQLVAQIVGGLTVNSSKTSTALVDLQPTVLNLGSQTKPQFAIATAADALQVPPGQVQTETSAGAKVSLQTQTWFSAFTTNHTDHARVVSVSLGQRSFSITLANPGDTPLTVRMIVITPGVAAAAASASPALTSSAILLIGQNGSLQMERVAANAVNPSAEVQTLLGSSGYQMQPGASATFTFSGLLVNSFVGVSGFVLSVSSNCRVTVIGDQVLASQIVKIG